MVGMVRRRLRRRPRIHHCECSRTVGGRLCWKSVRGYPRRQRQECGRCIFSAWRESESRGEYSRKFALKKSHSDSIVPDSSCFSNESLGLCSRLVTVYLILLLRCYSPVSFHLPIIHVSLFNSVFISYIQRMRVVYTLCSNANYMIVAELHRKCLHAVYLIHCWFRT
jgi:hypothetical protein